MNTSTTNRRTRFPTAGGRVAAFSLSSLLLLLIAAAPASADHTVTRGVSFDAGGPQGASISFGFGGHRNNANVVVSGRAAHGGQGGPNWGGPKWGGPKWGGPNRGGPKWRGPKWRGPKWRGPKWRDPAQQEYDRGYRAGQRAGENDGYRNGYDGRAYCGIPPVHADRCSPRFEQGFADAYARFYGSAYERGRRDRWNRSCGSVSW